MSNRHSWETKSAADSKKVSECVKCFCLKVETIEANNFYRIKYILNGESYDRAPECQPKQQEGLKF